jgi:hypothetical protein
MNVFLITGIFQFVLEAINLKQLRGKNKEITNGYVKILCIAVCCAVRALFANFINQSTTDLFNTHKQFYG